jgi:hypothetical protein
VSYLQFNKEGTGRRFEACMIQTFGMETSYHVYTATTVGGPAWPSIILTSMTSSRFSGSRFFAAFLNIVSTQDSTRPRLPPAGIAGIDISAVLAAEFGAGAAGRAPRIARSRSL